MEHFVVWDQDVSNMPQTCEIRYSNLVSSINVDVPVPPMLSDHLIGRSYSCDLFVEHMFRLCM